ncbi:MULTISPECIES: hypothetical protein [unclassified Pseudomonas]|uniref:hypothetical protein n=1 Tax=unclassified Pseudomonas TaxID=196821 RepID=UPI0011F086E5|nr:MULTISPECIES: hypothetical protein [unclassified Pseudomonas]KAA0943669.1 hypothetical protein FQ182_24010 [Pseudomonas sp. ANT_H4]KAA0947968.1 hypothetical protein FQ186_24205 [Pseudomonas sp. ANT_H14]
MSSAAWRLAGIGLAVLLLLAVGAAGGARLAAGHYRPLLDTANSDLSTAKNGRDNLEVLAGEQGKKLGELVQAGELRERSGGDPVQAAESIIDQALGL